MGAKNSFTYNAVVGLLQLQHSLWKQPN